MFVCPFPTDPKFWKTCFCFVFVLFCFVLFCFVLFCFVLFCFGLFCFVLFCFVLFFLFCFVFLIFNFAFLNKIVKIKVSKYIVTVPKVHCVGTEGPGQKVYVYPIYFSTRLFDVTCLNTENYINISLTSRLKKKGGIDLPTLPIFRPKG